MATTTQTYKTNSVDLFYQSGQGEAYIYATIEYTPNTSTRQCSVTLKSFTVYSYWSLSATLPVNYTFGSLTGTATIPPSGITKEEPWIRINKRVTVNVNRSITVNYNDEGNASFKLIFSCEKPNISWISQGGRTVSFNVYFSNDYVSVPKIDPAYKKPTISISTTRTISVYNQTRNVTVEKNNSGDTNATTTYLQVNGKSKFDTELGNSGGNVDFIPSSYSVGDAATYKVKAYRKHNKSNVETTSNELELYTYRTPTVSNVTISNGTVSGRGTGSISWYTNGRYWGTDTEADFKTYIYFNSEGSWKSIGNDNPNTDKTSASTQSIDITKGFITSHFSDEQRNNASYETKFKIRRKNETSGVTADSGEVKIKIQFKPVSKVTDIEYYDWTDTGDHKGSRIASGAQLYVHEHENLLVTWRYPDNVNNGEISGYYVKFYTSLTGGTASKTYTVNTTSLSSYQKVNIKTDLTRRKLNYVGITPFYKQPDGTILEGEELRQEFVLPVGMIHKPIIAYPITDTTWHNNKFRILLQNPEDDDWDTYTTAQQNSYTYNNIQVKINDTTYSLTDNVTIFSTKTPGHTAKLCINPSNISNFPDVKKYEISIRYQKKYDVNVWSDWSDTITLNIESLTNAIYEEESEILAEHYNTVRNYGKRLYDCYPMFKLSTNHKNIVKNDIIYQKYYSAIYNGILGIQSSINDYGVYDIPAGSTTVDDNTCKMQEKIVDLSGASAPTDDIITAVESKKPAIQGRNYLITLVDCMNQLI